MAQPSRAVMMSRALHLKCPRCGQEKLFSSWFRMQPRCSHCGLKYERGPGYFLGSIYINYGLTAMLTTIAFVGLRFGAGIEGVRLLGPLLAFCVIFPLLFFPFARAYWLAMDLSFDAEEDDHDPGDLG